MSDNPLQYLISLPLAMIGILVVLQGEKMLFDYLGWGSIFLVVGFISFVLIICGSFVLGDILISKIEVKRKR
jgi:hypothetical protein